MNLINQLIFLNKASKNIQLWYKKLIFCSPSLSTNFLSPIRKNIISLHKIHKKKLTKTPKYFHPPPADLKNFQPSIAKSSSKSIEVFAARGNSILPSTPPQSTSASEEASLQSTQVKTTTTDQSTAWIRWEWQCKWYEMKN